MQTTNKEDLLNFQMYSKGTNGKAVLILHGFTAEVERTEVIFKFFQSKGFTVARPVLPGHSGREEDKLLLVRAGPEEWLNDAKAWIERLSREENEIYIIGISFGGNMGVSLCLNNGHKIKGLILMEMPIFFNLRISLVMKLVQPLVELVGINFIKKNGLVYRRRYREGERRGTFPFIPVKAVGKIRKFINNHTKRELAKINTPTFILHAEKSDLLNNDKNVKFICDRIASKHKKTYCIPINNHDLSVLDEPGKIVMLEKIYNFIEQTE